MLFFKGGGGRTAGVVPSDFEAYPAVAQCSIRWGAFGVAMLTSQRCRWGENSFGYNVPRGPHGTFGRVWNILEIGKKARRRAVRYENAVKNGRRNRGALYKDNHITRRRSRARSYGKCQVECPFLKFVEKWQQNRIFLNLK